MAESDPYSTSYAEKPVLAKSVKRSAAKRMRKESLNRGEKDRQEIEVKAPAWKNEPGAATTTPPKGSTLAFQAGSNEGGLHYNLKKRS